MSSITIQVGATFAAGETVKAYAADRFNQAPTGPPPGSSAATSVVGSDGTLTFAGLGEDTSYFAYAASPFRYIRFRVDQVADGAVITTVSREDLDLRDYGASDAPGVDNTPAVVAALAALPTDPVSGFKVGTIYIPAGTWEFHSSLPKSGPFVTFKGAGKEQTVCAYYGSGAFFNLYGLTTMTLTDPDNWMTRGYFGTLLLDGMTIDGSNASAGAVGVKVGGLTSAQLGPDVLIWHFNKTGSIGMQVGTETWWTEKLFIPRLVLGDNTTAVHVSSTANWSFAYNDWTLEIFAVGQQDGVVLEGAAYLYNSKLTIRGNFDGNAGSNSAAALRIGTGAGDTSKIDLTRLDVQCEAYTLGGLVGHHTLMFGDVVTNKLRGCSGFLSFTSDMQNSNWVPSLDNHLGFDGYIAGDVVLRPFIAYSLGGVAPDTPVAVSTIPRGSTKGNYYSASSSIDLQSGDYFNIGQLSANVSLVFACGVENQGRRITVVAQQGNSPYKNITWPSNGSPGVGSPTVVWENGIPPLLSQSPGVTDTFELWTDDGRTWWGRQRPAFAAPPTIPTYTVRGHVNGTGLAARTITPSANTTVGNTVFALIGNLTSGSAATPTVTDSKSNTWTVDKGTTSTGANVFIARARLTSALTTSDTVTITFSGATAMDALLVEVTGLGSAAVLDSTAVADTATTSSASVSVGPTGTSGANNSIAFALVAAATGDTSNPTFAASGANWDVLLPSNALGSHVAVLLMPAAATAARIKWVPSTSQALAGLIAVYHA